MPILMRDLNKLYNGEPVDSLPISYKDFAVFENERFENGLLKDAENYWLEQFKGDVPVLDFQTGPRPSVQTFEGNTISALIDKNLFEKIKAVSNSLQVTPYMLLLSCYYILLEKYTSQEDIVIGTPTSGRNTQDTSGLIGMFVNTLALRNKVDCNLSFKEFVFQIKENVLDSFEYQDYPFDELTRKLGIKRDTSRNPLFDTMFVYQNNGYQNLEFQNIPSHIYSPSTHISKFDLTLEIVPNGNDATIHFEYATKLFDESFIRNLSYHYFNIIQTILHNMDIRISDIDMLSQGEKNRILYDFNNTKLEYIEDINILDLFESQVEKHPDTTAVVFEGQEITYQQLNERANMLANHLVSVGVTNQDTIAILLGRSIDLIISVYAVIKSGASYTLLDTSLPEKRIHYIIENSNAKYCILNDQSIREGIGTKNIINLDKSDFSIYNQQNLNLKLENNLSIIYTSGSTGEPKGVVLNKSRIFKFNHCL